MTTKATKTTKTVKTVKTTKTTKKPKSSYDPSALRYMPLRLVAPSKPGGRWSCVTSKTKRVDSREYYRLYMSMKREAQKLLGKTSKHVAKKTVKTSPVKTVKTVKTTKHKKPTAKTAKPKAPKKPKAWRVWVKCSPDLEDWSERARKAFIDHLDKASRNPKLVKSMTPDEHALYLRWTLGTLL